MGKSVIVAVFLALITVVFTQTEPDKNNDELLTIDKLIKSFSIPQESIVPVSRSNVEYHDTQKGVNNDEKELKLLTKKPLEDKNVDALKSLVDDRIAVTKKEKDITTESLLKLDGERKAVLTKQGAEEEKDKLLTEKNISVKDPRILKPNSKDELDSTRKLSTDKLTNDNVEEVLFGRLPFIPPLPLTRMLFPLIDSLPVDGKNNASVDELPPATFVSDRLPLPEGEVLEADSETIMAKEDNAKHPTSSEVAEEILSQIMGGMLGVRLPPPPPIPYLPVMPGYKENTDNVKTKENSEIIDLFGRKFLMNSKTAEHPVTKNGKIILSFMSLRPLLNTSVPGNEKEGSEKEFEIKKNIPKESKPEPKEGIPERKEIPKAKDPLEPKGILKEKGNDIDSKKDIFRTMKDPYEGDMIHEPKVINVDETREIKTEKPDEFAMKEADAIKTSLDLLKKQGAQLSTQEKPENLIKETPVQLKLFNAVKPNSYTSENTKVKESSELGTLKNKVSNAQDDNSDDNAETPLIIFAGKEGMVKNSIGEKIDTPLSTGDSIKEETLKEKVAKELKFSDNEKTAPKKKQAKQVAYFDAKEIKESKWEHRKDLNSPSNLNFENFSPNNVKVLKDESAKIENIQDEIKIKDFKKAGVKEMDKDLISEE